MKDCAFNRPHPGETENEQKARQEDIIRFIIEKHKWLRPQAIELLESLDLVGLAYIGVDKKLQMRETLQATEYDPFRTA